VPDSELHTPRTPQANHTPAHLFQGDDQVQQLVVVEQLRRPRLLLLANVLEQRARRLLQLLLVKAGQVCCATHAALLV
jgi:hypothetical protein